MSEEGREDADEPDIILPPGMTSEQVDQSREVFNRVTGKDREQVELPTEDPLPEEEAPAEEEVAETEPADSPEEEPSVASAEEQGLRDAAYRALRRVKTPKAVLDRLEDTELIEWGNALNPLHDEVDRSYGELKDLRARLEGYERDASENNQTGADTAVPPAELTLDKDAITPFLESLGIDSDEGFEAASKFAQAIFQQERAQHQGQIASLSESMMGVASLLARRDLGEQFPAVLDDDNAWNDVRTKAQTYMKSGDYTEEPSRAWHEAALVVLGNPSKNGQTPEESSSQKKSAPRKRSAQPTTRTKPPAEKPKMTKDEKDRTVFNYIQEHPGDKPGLRAEKARLGI